MADKLTELRERIKLACNVIQTLSIGALSDGLCLAESENLSEGKASAKELIAFRTLERELMAAEQPAIEPAELLLNGQPIAPLAQATGADESVSEPQPELRRQWSLLRLEQAFYSQIRPGTFADGCLHAARLDIDDIVVKLAASESEAQEMLAKVRGIVEEWEGTSPRCSEREAFESMVKIYRTVKP